MGTSGGSGVEVGGREVAGDRRKRLAERPGFLAFAVDLVIPKVVENRGDRNAPGRGLAEVPAAVAIKMVHASRLTRQTRCDISDPSPRVGEPALWSLLCRPAQAVVNTNPAEQKGPVLLSEAPALTIVTARRMAIPRSSPGAHVTWAEEAGRSPPAVRVVRPRFGAWSRPQ